MSLQGMILKYCGPSQRRSPSNFPGCSSHYVCCPTELAGVRSQLRDMVSVLHVGASLKVCRMMISSPLNMRTTFLSRAKCLSGSLQWLLCTRKSIFFNIIVES